MRHCICCRRSALVLMVSALAAAATRVAAAPAEQHREFIAAAFKMRDDAVKSGDQAFGAVVVKDGRIVGFGPSRVVTKKDWMAHAEREAIADARIKLAARDLSGCVLYSSSRPCSACEAAAFEAKIARMYFGANATDGGPPKRS